jgi:oxalate decarboxylase/phosphoglucose isomerase-like protein (cupin superfamily)
MLVNIEKVPILQKNERGTSHGFSARESKYFTVLTRREGSISGNHYHKGKTKSKSPEILYFVKGRAKLAVEDTKTGEKEVHEINENTKVEIPAGIYHKVTALTDIIFLELATGKEDFEGDTVRL